MGRHLHGSLQLVTERLNMANGVKFVRVHGRIVPIRQKGQKGPPGAKTHGQLASKFKKAATSARYSAYADAITGTFSAVGAVAALEAAKHAKTGGKRGLYAGLAGGMAAGALVAAGSLLKHAARGSAMQKLAKRFGKRSSV
jgi:hypothetical protein